MKPHPRALLAEILLLLTAVLEAGPSRRLRPPARHWIAPVLLACLFGAWALRGLPAGGLVSTDAARHAMNGALIHDWLAEGPLTSPGDYARWYYSRWPALSLGYHPPVFPVLEAAAFSVLGVSPLAARLLVAVLTGLTGVALYALVLGTHGSRALALAASGVTLALPVSQRVSQDVMLEVPAMAFVLLALLCLPRGTAPFTLRHALAFAACAAAAVWTKQIAVFLGAVPVGLALLKGRRDWLTSRAVWIAAALVAAAFAGTTLFELAFGDPSPRRFAILRGLPRVLTANTLLYGSALLKGPGLLALLAVGGAIVLAARNRTRLRERLAADGLYWAWAAAALTALLLGKWNTTRYLYFLWPPLVVLGCATMFRLLSHLAPPRQASAALLVTATAIGALWLTQPLAVLDGPAEAAVRVAADGPSRVLYAGESDGHFAFQLRSSAGSTTPVVIRGDKLPPDTFDREAIETFAATYGVTHVVFERTREVTPWDHLMDAPTPSLELLAQVPVTGIRQGIVQIYRFTGAADAPKHALTISSDKLGEPRPVRLDWSMPAWHPQADRR